MRRLGKWICSTLFVLCATPSAYAQCNAEQLVGQWLCRGECTPNRDISRLFKRDGIYVWEDGVGHQGLVTVAGHSIYIAFSSGGPPLVGSLSSNCASMQFNPRHGAVKLGN